MFNSDIRFEITDYTPGGTITEMAVYKADKRVATIRLTNGLLPDDRRYVLVALDKGLRRNVPLDVAMFEAQELFAATSSRTRN